MRHTLLIVDDTPENIDLLAECLRGEFDLRVAVCGARALDLLEAGGVDLVLLDIMMPEMSGFEVCKRIKANPAHVDLPVLFLTAMSADCDEAYGLSLGAVDYITKPFNPALVRARIRNHIELKEHRDNLEGLVVRRSRQLTQARDALIVAMANMAEYRDPETGGHIKRTQRYMRLLAEHLKDHPRFKAYLTPTAIDALYKFAPLHDVGKVAVPDAILLKPGKLDADEWTEMKRHTEYGRDVIETAQKTLGGEAGFLDIARDIAYAHQERWDGSGYPRALKGDDIPICARLMAVADVYDALISKRVYKPPFSHRRAVEILTQGDGRTLPEHFDPDVLAAFEACAPQFCEVALEYADFEEERQTLLS